MELGHSASVLPLSNAISFPQFFQTKLQMRGMNGQQDPPAITAPSLQPEKTSESSLGENQKPINPPLPPWYRKEIGPRLTPSTRAFFQSYVGLSGQPLEDHLHHVVCNSTAPTMSYANIPKA